MTEDSRRGAGVRAEAVHKRFPDGTIAIDRLDLDVEAGQFVALVGPSGCGKSTFLRLVAGLSEVSSGILTVDGLPPPEARAKHRRLAFVPQDPTLLRWRRVRDNVALPLELRHVPQADVRKRVDEALDLVGLLDVGQMYPHQLSGGMRMRVSIARALATDPTLLLMDEPFGALDEITRQRLEDELLALWQECHFTCLFVTHSVQEAAYLSQRLLVMGPRPARIAAVHEIRFSGPRLPTLRTETTFVSLVASVSTDLSDAIETGRASS